MHHLASCFEPAVAPKAKEEFKAKSNSKSVMNAPKGGKVRHRLLPLELGGIGSAASCCTPLCFAIVRSSAQTSTSLLQAKDAKRAEVKAKKLEKAGLGPNTLTKK